MYAQAKSIVRKLIPQSFLFRNELVLRKVLIPFYKGNKYTCPLCNKSWRKFIILPSNDLLCPYCGSRSRTRRLFKILKEDKALKGKVLHFSPSRSLYRTFKKDHSFSYYSTDFENEFLADFQLDITQIDMPDNSFDTIICYHILEHIDEDLQAIEELKRVLKSSGKCYIQTPFKTGEIYEDDSIKNPEDRLRAFGQEDHVRIYSIDGLLKRLECKGLKTECFHFKEEIIPNGFLKESVIIATK